MKILEQEQLKKYTTIRIGGTASKLYIPETRDELIDLLNQLSDEKVYILGGGSNILMDDKAVFSHVIYMGQFDQGLEYMGDGVFWCGASVRLQKLIQFTNEQGYGGVEYLMSVPGMMGGAVLMNAGRGRKHNQTISDYILEVEVWEDGVVKWLTKDACQFSHRSSLFKGSNMVILGMRFKFKQGDKQELEQKRKDRIEFSNSQQDHSCYNFGSVFCSCNNIAMRLIRYFGLFRKGDISFSRKTSNWLLNKGNGTFSQAENVLGKAERLNRIMGTKAEREVIIWK